MQSYEKKRHGKYFLEKNNAFTCLLPNATEETIRTRLAKRCADSHATDTPHLPARLGERLASGGECPRQIQL